MLFDYSPIGVRHLALPTAPKILFAQAQERGWLRVYETHPLGAFRKLSIVDEFLKLTRRCSSLRALGSGPQLVVYRKERNY